MKKLLAATLVSAVLAVGCAGMKKADMPDAPTRTVDGVLIGPNGNTLYVFSRDVAGSNASACNGACATNWPPLMAPGSAKSMGGYAVITRADGTKQWAYNGWPLHYWSKDTKAGDRTGDGVGGNWKIARP
ncbi:MAG: ATP-binding protein [Variovorax sp.]